MSNKSTRRKISLELPKKASVFDRLGTKNPLAICKKQSEISVNRRKLNSETLRVKVTNKLLSASVLGSSKPQQIRLIKEEGSKRLCSAVSVVSIQSIVHDIKPNRGPEISSWESWDQRKLEEEDEKTLEKKRLLLQKELEREMAATKQRDKEKDKKRSPSSSSTSTSSSSSSSDSSSSDSSTDSSSSSESSDKVIDKKRKTRSKDKLTSSSLRSKKRASSSSSPDSKRNKDKKKAPTKKRNQAITPTKSITTSHRKVMPKSVKPEREVRPKDKSKDKLKVKEKEKQKDYEKKIDKIRSSTNRKQGGRSFSRSPVRKSTSKRSVSPIKLPRKRSHSPSPKVSNKLRREASPDIRSKNLNRDELSPLRKNTSSMSRSDRRRDNCDSGYSRDKQRESPRSHRRCISSRKLSPDRRDQREKDRKVTMSRGSSPNERGKRDDYALPTSEHDLRESRDLRDLRDRDSDRRGKSIDNREERSDWKDRREPSHESHISRIHHDDYRGISTMVSSRGMRDSSREVSLRRRDSDISRAYDGEYDRYDDAYWNYDEPILEPGPSRVPLSHSLYREDRRRDSDWNHGRLGPLPLLPSDRINKNRRLNDWDPAHRGRGRGRNDKDWLGRPRRRDGDGKRHHEIPASTLQALASVPSLMDIEVSPIIKVDSKEALPPSLLVGDDGDSPDRNKTWEFNPKSKTWERKIDPPIEKKNFSDKDQEPKEIIKNDIRDDKKQHSDSKTTIDADNFSDFSDDADEILNREEPEECIDDDDKVLEADKKDIRSEDRSDQEEVWDGMDFEEISDEEQFEEDGSKPSIVDALEVDWASLVSTPYVLSERCKGLQFMKRYSPRAMLMRLGCLVPLLREDIVIKVDSIIQNENSDGTNETNTKNLNIWHTSKFSATELLTEIGPFRRALCARKDLEIRRKLCQLPEKELGVESVTLVNDTDLYRSSVHLFTTRINA